MLYRLIYLTGSRTGQRVTVETEPMVMGRGSEAVILLDDPESAERHAEIVHRGEAIFVRDLGSMNRLLVNQREVTESRLKHGDLLEVGRTRFLVQCSVQAEVVRPSRRRPARRGVLALVAVLLALGYVAYERWPVSSPSPAPAPVPPPPPAAVAAVPPAPVAPAAPVAAPIPVPAPADTTTGEIGDLRRQLAELDQTVKNLASAPPSAPAPAPVPAPTFRPEDPLKERTRKMLAAARADAEAGRWAEADRQLANLQIIDPDFLEAYLQRAVLMEKRGMIKKSIEQWTEVVRRSVGTPLYDRAVAERIRLGKLDAGTDEEELVFRIVDAEVRRFPESEEYAEMRLLTVRVQPPPGVTLDPAAIRLESTFYVLAEPDAPPLAVTTLVSRLEGEGPGGGDLTLTASYVRPKGQAAAGEFHGYVTGLYYRNRLRATDARPRSLLVAGAAGQSIF